MNKVKRTLFLFLVLFIISPPIIFGFVVQYQGNVTPIAVVLAVLILVTHYVFVTGISLRYGATECVCFFGSCTCAFLFFACLPVLLYLTNSAMFSLKFNLNFTGIVLLKIIILALWEEFIFRVLFFKLCEKWLSSSAVIILSAIFFGLIHWGQHWLDVLTTMVFGGIILGVLYHKTRSLAMVWGFHVGINVYFFTVNKGFTLINVNAITWLKPEYIANSVIAVPGIVLLLVLWRFQRNVEKLHFAS